MLLSKSGPFRCIASSTNPAALITTATTTPAAAPYPYPVQQRRSPRSSSPTTLSTIEDATTAAVTDSVVSTQAATTPEAADAGDGGIAVGFLPGNIEVGRWCPCNRERRVAIYYLLLGHISFGFPIVGAFRRDWRQG